MTTQKDPCVHLHMSTGEVQIHIWSSPHEMGISAHSDTHLTFSDGIAAIKTGLEGFDEEWIQWIRRKEKQE